MKVNPAIVEAVKCLDPTRPAPQEHYIARGWDLPKRLVPLLLAGHRVRALLLGPVGGGKTTELRRWEAELAEVATVAVVPMAPGDGSNQVGSLLDRAAKTLAAVVLPTAPQARIDGNCLADSVLAATGKPALVLVDGFDLLGSAAGTAAFGPGGSLCDERLPSIVYTALHGMITLDLNQSRHPRFDAAWHLPAFPVVTPDGSRAPGAIAPVAEGLRRRLDGLDELGITAAQLEEVAFSPAGIPRDAIRILRSAVLAASTAGRVNAQHLNEGLREVRQDLEQGLQGDDPRLLAAVARDRVYRGGDRLVVANAVVRYESEDGGYWQAHPLLGRIVGPKLAEASRG